MSECEELNTLKEKLGELEEIVAEIEERINDLESDENSEDVKDTVRELVDAAENWDYGLKRWRTLATKQDLINYLKKEVLEA